MRIDSVRDRRAGIIRPHGVLTGNDAEGLEREARRLLEAGARDLVIDITNLAFVDSRGLEAMVNLAEGQIRTGRTVKLAGKQPVIEEVLELTELAPLFESYQDTKSAVEHCL